MRYIPTVVGVLLLLIGFILVIFTPLHYLGGVAVLTAILFLAIGSSIQK